MRRTKIIATLGPSTEDAETLRGLIDAGLDVARLNASHAGPAELASRLELVRSVAEETGKHVAVMLDLAGPKLRVGEMAPDTVLEAGSEFVLSTDEMVGDAAKASVTYAGLTSDVSPGDRIVIDDGRIELRVERAGGNTVVTTVVVGGPLTSYKGVNVPGVRLNVEPVTRFDRAMVEWAVAKNVDLVAQSFVRHPDDVHLLRDLMKGASIPIVAKIEKHEAAESLDAIVAAADAIMVARGDLGVETAPETVPVLQRRIIDRCRASGTPVIIATQMLESMTHAKHPTRAEASDVANAIFDCVDAVMLSGETAIGDHPVLVVETMERIITSAEVSQKTGDKLSFTSGGNREDVTQAVSAAVCDLAEDLELAAIVTATQSGATARAVARHRPPTLIVAVTPHESVARALMITWGVHPVVVQIADDTDEMLDVVTAAVREKGFAGAGDRVAVTAGISSRVPGHTDFIVVRTVQGTE